MITLEIALPCGCRAKWNPEESAWRAGQAGALALCPLHAAAGEMLAALRAVAGVAESGESDIRNLDWNLIEAAITKAEIKGTT